MMCFSLDCSANSGKKKCIFPFKHNGKTYATCTRDGGRDRWCSIVNNADGTMKERGNCDSSCDGEYRYKCMFSYKIHLQFLIIEVLILGGGIISENLLKGSFKIYTFVCVFWGVLIGNSYLKKWYKIVLFMPTCKLIHSFSTKMYNCHLEISLNSIWIAKT